MFTRYAFESEIERSASTARKRTEKYAEDGAEPISRFMTKSQTQSPALLELEFGGAYFVKVIK